VERVTVLRTISAAQIEEHRDILCRWVEANGIKPATVAIEDMTVEKDVGRTVIRYQEIQRSPEARPLVDPDGSDRVWLIERIAPQSVDLDSFGYPQETA
jgi:hypothetical protein